MITEFVKQFDLNRELIKEKIRSNPRPDYRDLLQYVLEAIVDEDEWHMYTPDPERIHCIDDGDYQGTLVFVIPSKGYQPRDYWYTMVSYGSCGGCDTLQAIHNDYDWSYEEDMENDNAYDYDKVSDSQVERYFNLALHMFQNLEKMS